MAVMTPEELAQIRARDGRLPADLPSHWQLQIDRRRLLTELERASTQVAELAAWASAGAAANESHPLAAEMHQRLADGEFGPITGGLGPCDVDDPDGDGTCGAAAVQIRGGFRLCYWHRVPR